MHRPTQRAPVKTAALPAPTTSFFNREISWIDFNARVLAEAEDPENPLLERLRFIAIFDSNLDEFFMKRVGGLKQQVASNLRQLTPDGRTPRQQLDEIQERVRPLLARQRLLLNGELRPALARHGLEIVSWERLTDDERRHLGAEFEARIFPILTPLAVDPAHPFPFISNLSVSLAVAVRAPGEEETRFARVKVPASLPRWLQLPDTLRYAPLEEVIAHNLERLFPGMEQVACHPFRVTRNADVQRYEEPADDLLEAIQEELRERRFATVVRLETEPGMPDWMRELLCEELEIRMDEVYEVALPLGLRDLSTLCAAPLPGLKFPPWSPQTPPRLHTEPGKEADVFRATAAGDLLVHHPYDSFAASVQRLLEAAADDPAVLAIKQTLYRTSSDSSIMGALIRAAEAGKQVAATIEIKARFDEERNIGWAEALEGAGAHVAYGVVGFKTHTKVALVIRQEKEQLRSYVHIATGNYNADTARLYTDLGLFTCNEDLAADVVQLFNVLTGYVHRPTFKKLLVAPFNMRSRFLELIAREIEHQKA
ncbi:MAG TPA: polyphosphate kinase 1, partial [Thermoanaerobaculia bacterium]|nr:polyphosphate kinase 1 [Thermoanaerobaculia bacterium]